MKHLARCSQTHGSMDRFMMSSEDSTTRGWSSYSATNRTGMNAFSLMAKVNFCPESVGNANDTLLPCALDPPVVNVSSVNAISATQGLMQEASPTTFFDGPMPIFGEAWRPPIFNFVQLAVAAIRIDLGNPSPNNLLTHPTVFNRSLTKTFPEIGAIDLKSMPSVLYAHLEEQSLLAGTDSGSALDPFRVPGPSVVQTVYVCKFLKRKSAANLIVSVFVATAGMFTSGWAVFIFVARCITERREKDAD